MMNSAKTFVRDQLKFARDGANNLARRHGYKWINWQTGRTGRFTAGFEREGRMWSFDFYWTPTEELSVLAHNIEHMDHIVRVAMKEFAALKLGALMREHGSPPPHIDDLGAVH